MRISDWSSDVCSSDLERLVDQAHVAVLQVAQAAVDQLRALRRRAAGEVVALDQRCAQAAAGRVEGNAGDGDAAAHHPPAEGRSEERRHGTECVSTGRSGWAPYH